MELIDIVDREDRVVGNATRQEIYEKLLPHRIVHILVFNSKNQLALNLISKNSKSYPLHWGSSVAGHVQSGETYEQAATRELEEELGINPPLQFLEKQFYKKENTHEKVLGVFKTVYSGQLKVNKEEVENIRFFSLSEIRNMITGGEKIAPELLFLLEKYFGVK